MLKMKF